MRRHLTYLVTAILVLVLSSTAQAQDPKKPQRTAKPAFDPLRITLTDPAKTSFGGALYTDVKQGSYGTCWIDASIAALAHKRDLSRLISYQGDNRYAVTLYICNNKNNRPKGGYHPLTEKVFFSGKRTSADPQFDPEQPGESWVVIMHRAVIQAVSRIDRTQNIKTPHGGDAADALAILTGRWPTEVSLKDAHLQQKVIAAVAARRVIVYGTSDKATKLVKGHSYAVVSADQKGVTLYNPWGSPTTVSWKTIRQEGDTFYLLGI